MPVISFDDGSQQVYAHSVLLTDIIKNIKPSIRQTLISVAVNDRFSNIDAVIKKDSKISFFYKQDDDTVLNIIRYSCAQILGYALKLTWPLSKIGKHDITSNGFYCDVDIENNISEKDLLLLNNCMQNIIKKQYNVLIKKFSFQEAKDIFLERSEHYKASLINEIIDKKENIFLYYHEQHIDFDIGMQVFNVKFCKYFKLQNVSGAYWKNNKKNKMLQRIYGTAWCDQDQIDKYLNYIEELDKRDHRRIGKFLKLYHIHEASPGMIFWHNNGWIIFNELELFVRNKLKKYQYQEVKTPLLMDKSIWKESGHWDNYKDSIFTTLSENREYCIKPMNCPGHVQIFNVGIKSYRDLPIRMAEFGSCHRNESSGSLHGLMRVRNFTQDDAHIFCTTEQVRSEIHNCITMIYDFYDVFNFKNILVKLSTRPKKRIGHDRIWDKTEKDLSDALLESNLSFEYQIGEGAFYGPKIEFILQDSLNRHWQCGTIQLDFYLPSRLNAVYIDENNQRKFPVMIHRAILGSIERFIGILIEESSGHLPVWLSPVQVIVVSISYNHVAYVQYIMKKLSNFNFRVTCDIRQEKIGFKIREHILYRVPYIIICGDKEMMNDKISLRTRNGCNLSMIDINVFIQRLQKEISTRSFCPVEE
ncbi:threonine--tRNA ligase [Buchnera aphidicola]|uniref:threonine--tRNA ligase n=1 Tax=Buchnera aphidicola TaxID=9 RepID=UPI0034642B6E